MFVIPNGKYWRPSKNRFGSIYLTSNKNANCKSILFIEPTNFIVSCSTMQSVINFARYAVNNARSASFFFSHDYTTIHSYTYAIFDAFQCGNDVCTYFDANYNVVFVGVRGDETVRLADLKTAECFMTF